jgi:hypothetical protein
VLLARLAIQQGNNGANDAALWLQVVEAGHLVPSRMLLGRLPTTHAFIRYS